MRLADLIEPVPPAYGDVPIEAVVSDSRAVRPGTLFFACPGTRVDGHLFVDEALRAGCSAVVGSKELPAAIAALLRDRSVPYLRVEDSAEALGGMAAELNGRPSASLTVVGVTGTNGKTTVSTLLYELFSALGHRSGLIGTTGIRIGDDSFPSSYTTPEAGELQRLLAAMVRSRCRYCFLEVTSHAIEQRRIAGVEFEGGIFTTLGHDHLDYHGTLEAYARVKQRFLRDLPPAAFALANADDERGGFMVAGARARVVFYGSGAEALLPWSVERCGEEGMDVRLGGHRVRTGLLGRHNAGNLAAALTAAVLLGEDIERLIALVPSLRGARGRMHRVVSGAVLGIVDYAHTPEAVRLALETTRSLRPDGRLLVVGGCGGERDRGKRPAMGAALAAADVAFFTSDNPRSEDSAAIAATMLEGVPATRRTRVRIEADRRRAIQLAAQLASPGDVVLVLGKGHETAQEISATKHPWDDASELRLALEEASRHAAAERTRRSASQFARSSPQASRRHSNE